GVYSNSPIEVVFDEDPRVSSVVFAIQIWPTRGPRPESLTQAFMRQNSDLVVANDAATLPASLKGIHCPSGNLIEVRLAAWDSVHDATQFAAVAFGAGDHRTRTEDRISPPVLSLGDRLSLGPLVGIVDGLLDHPRLFRLRFLGDRAS